MQNEQAKIEKALAEYAAEQERRGAYFSAQTAYACALGNGTATEAMRLNVVALKAAYYGDRL